MSTPGTLPRRLLRGTLWAMRKALALAVAIAYVGVLGLALTVVWINVSDAVREMGMWKTVQAFGLVAAGVLASGALVAWASIELFGDKK